MNFLRIALLSAAGLAASAAVAAPASADGIDLGVSLGGRHGPRGFVDLHLGDRTRTHVSLDGRAFRPAGYAFGGYAGFYGNVGGYRAAPVGAWNAYPAAAYSPYAFTPQQPAVDSDCREVWIPAYTTFREQVVIDPPVYASRQVPVMNLVTVPVFAERFDPRLRRMVRVRVGERQERVQVGMRTERVLVFAGGSHVVRIPETIPGRFVVICSDGSRHHHGRHGRDGDRDGGRDHGRDHARELETVTEAEYRALLQNAQAFSAHR